MRETLARGYARGSFSIPSIHKPLKTIIHQSKQKKPTTKNGSIQMLTTKMQLSSLCSYLIVLKVITK